MWWFLQIFTDFFNPQIVVIHCIGFALWSTVFLPAKHNNHPRNIITSVCWSEVILFIVWSYDCLHGVYTIGVAIVWIILFDINTEPRNSIKENAVFITGRTLLIFYFQLLGLRSPQRNDAKTLFLRPLCYSLVYDFITRLSFKKRRSDF